MRALLLSVTALILSFGVLLAGNSLQFVILGLRAGAEGFSLGAMGAITAAYFGGFAFGSLWCPRLVARIGHIRAFAALASVVSGMVLAHPLWPEPLPWIVMRFVTGFCFAGLFLVVESWLNARASNEVRGRLLSIYGIVAFGGYASGPLIVGFGSAEGFLLFVIASMLVSFSLVPVTVTRASAPVTETETEVRRYSLRRLYRETPLGLTGAVAVGAVQGAFIGLGPVFGDRLGLPAERVSLFMTAAMLAGLLLQYPFGWLSDRLDRRRVIALVALAGSLGIAFFAATLLTTAGASAGLLWGAFLTGAGIFPLYALVIAYTNDWMPEHSLVPVAATLILAYSIGSTVGAPIASFAMDRLGPAGLFCFISVVMAGLGVFAVFRMFRRDAPAGDHEASFTAASPGTVPLDLLTQDEQFSLDLETPAAGSRRASGSQQEGDLD